MTATCCDVSSFQGDIDWAAYKAAGHVGVIIRVSDGDSFLDDHWEINAKGAHAQGLPIVAYHFARFNKPVITQAQHAVDRVKATGIPVVRMMGDLEDNQAPSDMPSNWLEDYLEELDTLGEPAAIYSGSYWWNPRVKDGTKYAYRHSIIAQYPAPTKIPPSDPTKWAQWANTMISGGPRPLAGFAKNSGWQFSSIGQVAGITQNTDCNLIYDPSLFAVSTPEVPVAYLIKRANDPEIDITDGVFRAPLDGTAWADWQRILKTPAPGFEIVSDSTWNRLVVYTATSGGPFPSHVTLTGTLS